MKKTILMTTLSVVAITVSTMTATMAVAENRGDLWTENPKAGALFDSSFNPGKGFAPLVKAVEPSVVNINTTTKVNTPNFSGQPNEFWQRFFGGVPMHPAERQSLGSGFIINSDGYILTNNHVVADATEIIVKIRRPELELTAKVIGRDERMDLALIKVEAPEPLPITMFGDSDTLEVGEWVVAIGSPYGLARTVTAGIVSAKDRVIGAGPYDDFIQTDASINPGNSGGPLFNANGLVVGINTAIHSAGQGIGFAVPVNMAKKFIHDVMTKGRVTRGWLGVGIQELTPEIAKGMDLSVTKGVIISQVYEGSPADKAGFKVGDVITKFGSVEVSAPPDLIRTAGLTTPGTKIAVIALRNKKEIKMDVTIIEKDDEAEEAVRTEDGTANPDEARTLGMTVRALRNKEGAKAGVREGFGVRIVDVDPGGAAGKAGLIQGDVIVEVNRVAIKDADRFAKIIEKIKPGDSVLLLTVRGANYLYRVLKKP